MCTFPHKLYFCHQSIQNKVPIANPNAENITLINDCLVISIIILKGRRFQKTLRTKQEVSWMRKKCPPPSKLRGREQVYYKAEKTQIRRGKDILVLFEQIL